ncbi:class E sortase [Arthrobacter sp. YAF17]|uniref:class E sortase n=1 Tax=Arthrobacter sp. YAF17 TaxID=3233077 RepID=UPI003F8EA501
MSNLLNGRAEVARETHRPRRRRSLLAVQIMGELLITLGVIAALFVAWQLWWTNVEADAAQGAAVKQFVQEHQVPVPGDPAGTLPGKTDPADPADSGAVPVGSAARHGQAIGVVYVPRFGAEYSRPIIEGTSSDVIDTLGLGRYAGTAMPGAVGNFAMAGHRQTHGAVLDNIHTLVPGDKIYVQTADGFYTYVFRNQEIVLPDRTDVILPVPAQPGVQPDQRLLTMTSCNPRFGSEERIIAYSVFDSWQPLNAGPPAAIAKQLAALQGKG